MSLKVLKKGFTIVELVIVIAVIAILAGVLIPTFSNLVEKANESADIQAVRQMNTILKSDEALNGVPKNVEEVKEVLRNNNMSNYSPMVDYYIFSWNPESNTIILVNKKTNLAEYPSEYSKKAYIANWELLDGKVDVTFETLGVDSVESALQMIDSNQTIKLSNDTRLTKNPANITNNTDDYSIDLNGHTLTMKSSESIYVEAGGNAKISNGTIILDGNDATISVSNGASMILQDVTIINSTNKKGLIFLSGDNSRCDMKNCVIKTPVPVVTNGLYKYGDGVTLNMYNCVFGSASEWTYTGLILNTKGKYNVYNSTIYAEDQCIFNRCGEMYVENTICNYIPYNQYSKDSEWGSGNNAHLAPIVVGDWSNSYNTDAKCSLVDVEINIDRSRYSSYTCSDVVLSQDGTNSTYLICDTTISWEVCNYNNTSIIFGNVFVNGSKKNKGDKSN